MNERMNGRMSGRIRDTLVKRLFKLWAALLLTLVTVCVLLGLVYAGLHWGAPFDHSLITLDGEPLGPSRWHGGQGLAGFGALLLGAALLLLVVPLVLVLPLLIVVAALVAMLVAVLVTLAALAGVLTLLCSPLVLLAVVVWLMWRLAHRRTETAAEVRS